MRATGSIALPSRKCALALLGALLLGACGDDPQLRIDGPGGELRFEVHVEVLREARDRRRGLIGRAALDRNTGVLLVAPVEDELCVSNAEVGFGIDAVFVDAARRVVGAYRLEARAEGLVCERALGVVEVPAGVASTVSPGDAMTPSGFEFRAMP